MPSPLAIAQLARMVGHADLLAALGLPEDAELPLALTDTQREAARLLASDRAEAIAEALADEVRANDDIQDAGAAEAYLRERLAFLAPLLPDETRARIRASVHEATSSWH
jgi:hypothetical protein